ncbi:hypothetical protein ACFQ3Z_45075 [Streptomyces nogalater]
MLYPPGRGEQPPAQRARRIKSMAAHEIPDELINLERSAEQERTRLATHR